MNLKQTIAELEQQAARYTEAANTLRSLQQNGNMTLASAPKVAKAASKPGRKPNSSKKKSKVSPETRAKISEALRASHAARKAASA